LTGKERVKLKDVEIRIIVELMENSRRSDREIAKRIGVSQPTVSRLVKRLEKEGLIKEYTMIPDFRRLGYQIMGISFIAKPENETKEEDKKLRKSAEELEEKNPYALLTAANGAGIGKGRMFISLYRSYSRYAEAMNLAHSLPSLGTERIESFLVDLNDQSNYQIFTLRKVARNIRAFKKELTK